MTTHVDGAALRPQREGRGWSQQQLAEVAGVSARTVQRLECGGPAVSETPMALAAALDIGPEALTAVATATASPAPAAQAASMDFDHGMKLVWTVLAVIGFLRVAGDQLGKDAGSRDRRINERMPESAATAQ